MSCYFPQPQEQEAQEVQAEQPLSGQPMHFLPLFLDR
jgi:hypothetical protein